MIKIGFIGAGKVGTALAVQLNESGYDIAAVASRTENSAAKLASNISNCRVCENAQGVADIAELVFITTPDDSISQVAGEIHWRTDQGVVHCSGAGSLDILESARQEGARVGAFHPLQSFASVDHAIKNLPGSTFALEGTKTILDELKEIATALKGQYIELGAGDKVLYHAAAVIACNYMVTLIKIATDLWQGFGVAANDAIQALLPLLQGTVNNINNVGLPNCLTGPIARGDLGTIKLHLSSLKAKAPSLAAVYCELGLQTIPIALEKGTIDKEKAGELQEILMEVK